MLEGEAAVVEGVFTNPEITVTPSPFRLFSYQNITFRYPREFSFEAGIENEEKKTWTLRGEDLRIMYFVMSDTTTALEFAEYMISQYPPGQCRINNSEIVWKTDSKTLHGVAIEITAGETIIAQDIYQVPSAADGSKLLILQDTRKLDRAPSAEFRSAVKTMTESFRIAQ